MPGDDDKKVIGAITVNAKNECGCYQGGNDLFSLGSGSKSFTDRSDLFPVGKKMI